MSSIFKQNASKQTWLKILLVLSLVLAFSAYVLWDLVAGGPLTSFLGNRDRIVSATRRMGIFAPVLYLILQVLQIVFAPIPGQVVGGVGGYLFGWWGVLFTFIGSTIGYIIVVLLARKFGRPLLEKIFKKDSIAKFDFALGDNSAIILFLIFLLPGFPDDMIGCMAGLTDIPFKKLLILITIGRLPTIIATNYVGMGLGRDNLFPVIAFSVLAVLILGLIAWQRENIIAFLKSRKDQ